MTKYTAEAIGGEQGLTCSAIGIVTAYLMMALMIADPLWITEMDNTLLNLVIGAVIMLALGYLLGKKAGYAIIIEKRAPVLTGILYGMATLAGTAFLSGWVGFFQEGIQREIINGIRSYILGPFVLITIFGSIPAIVTSIWFGLSIKKRAKKYMALHEGN